MTSPTRPPKGQRRAIDPVTFSPEFRWGRAIGRRDAQTVYCEGAALETIAERYGTPVYVYSSEAITSSYRDLSRGLKNLRHTLCFAVKSNGNLSILKHLARLGSGFDVVSGGELEHLAHIGVPGNRIVFSGVGKTREEMREALRYRGGGSGRRRGILQFNVESEAEMEALLEEASRHRAERDGVPRAAVRVNPDVQAGGHPHISTGQHRHKFGLDWVAAKQLYLAHNNSPWVRWSGLSAHIGSQITSLVPFRRAVNRLAACVVELRREGIPLEYLDFGGGLGVRYTNEHPPGRAEYARMVARIIRPLGVHLLLEPGRSIIAQAGVLLTRVLYVKENRGKRFIVVDSGMNDLIRPALYGAVHPITKVTRGPKTGLIQRADIVGPVCETGDCFLHDWPIESVTPGELLAIWVAGAYGMSLASNYNARPRPAEVLVSGRNHHVIRNRETARDLIRGDVLA